MKKKSHMLYLTPFPSQVKMCQMYLQFLWFWSIFFDPWLCLRWASPRRGHRLALLLGRTELSYPSSSWTGGSPGWILPGVRLPEVQYICLSSMHLRHVHFPFPQVTVDWHRHRDLSAFSLPPPPPRHCQKRQHSSNFLRPIRLFLKERKFFLKSPY